MHTATEMGKYSRECAGAECERHSKDADALRSGAAGRRGPKPAEVKPRTKMEI